MPFRFTAPRALAAGTLPALSAGPLGLWGVARINAAYGGPAVRVQRASDGAQADIGFADGVVSLNQARAFAGVSALTPGVLLMVTDYDKSGNGQHATFTGRCYLISDRDSYGPAYPDAPSISINSQKLANYAAAQAQATMVIPSTLSFNAQAVADFAVLKPFATTYRQMLTALGASSGSARSTLYAADGGGGGAVLGSTVSGSYAGKAAAYSFAPRAVHQVVASISKLGGSITYLEDLSSTVAGTVDSQTLAGGGFGLTTSSDYFAALDYKSRSLWPTTLSDAELSTIAAYLQATFGTTKRANRLVWAGSSTPMGQGTLSLGQTSQMQGYVNLLVGLLDRPVDLFNTSISGRQLSDCISAAPNEVDALFLAGCNCIAVIDAGSNDAAGGADGPTIYGRVKSWIAGRRSAGFQRVGVVTIKQRSDITGTNETNRQSANSAIRSGQADLGYDFLIDSDVLGQMQAPFYSADPWMSPETGGSPFIHASPTGHALLAQAGYAALQPFLSAATPPTSTIAIKTAVITLGALGLSSTSATAGSAYTATITGRTTGSAITASSSDGTSLSVSGSTVSGTFSAAGSPTITLTETLSGAVGSPKASAIGVTVTAASSNAPAVGDMILINPYDSRSGGASAPTSIAGWNNLDQKIYTAPTTLALVNSTGAATPLAASLTTGINSGNSQSTTDGASVVPKSIADSFIFIDKANQAGNGTSTSGKLAVTGLAAGTTWKVEVFAYRNSASSRLQNITVGGSTQSPNVGTSGTPSAWTATYTGVVPSSGEIDILIAQNGSENFAYINAARLTRTA